MRGEDSELFAGTGCGGDAELRFSHGSAGGLIAQFLHYSSIFSQKGGKKMRFSQILV